MAALRFKLTNGQGRPHTEDIKMTYKQNIEKTINGELKSRLAPRNKQSKGKGHKESTLPKNKLITKLIKYLKRAA